jgi:hypothetical protein
LNDLIEPSATSSLLLASTAAAMGAVVQVFKGRGGKMTLAAWTKVRVPRIFPAAIATHPNARTTGGRSEPA